MTARKDTISRYFPPLTGLIFIGLGTLILIRPDVLEYYSIGVDNAPARIATRAMIGGGEIALGLVILLGQRIGLTIQQRSLIAALVFLGVGLARMAAAWFEGGFGFGLQPYREATVEIALAALGFIVASRTKRIDEVTPD